MELPLITRQNKTIDLPRVEKSADGVWHIRGYFAAKVVLTGETRQDGFKRELVEKMPAYMRKPVLYQDGAAHREQRSQTGRFFSPAAVQQRHMPLMEQVADAVVADFVRRGNADLNVLSAEMSTSVVAQVVGLTESPLHGLTARLSAILHSNLGFTRSIRSLVPFIVLQWHMASFWLLDVAPAIRARKRNPQEDLISHLISKEYGNGDILAECITYGAAGMVTTQEFICAAAWHLLKNTELRERFLSSEKEDRYRMLYELLRLEPVVGHLYRRAAEDLTVPVEGGEALIPADARIHLDIGAINRDSEAMGAEPLSFDMNRVLEKGTPPAGLSFGMGPHRCAGEHLAIAESDVFLRRLLVTPGLKILKEPVNGYNATIEGYELRGFILQAG